MENQPDRPPSPQSGAPSTLTILGTTDLHGDLLGWDYYADREFGQPAGLARVAAAIGRIRAERPAGSVVLVDVGDTIQGNPLASYFATRDDVANPMASAMNTLDYAAATVGNHEFNYGMATLRRFESAANFPVVVANLDGADGTSVFRPWVLHTALVDRREVRVGIVGVTTPGSAVWDRSNVGDLTFRDLVEGARRGVDGARAAGADVVVVLSHSGLGPFSTYGDAYPQLENATALIAEQVDGIDAIVLGHAHASVCEHRTSPSGRSVPLVEPSFSGHQLALIELELSWSESRPVVTTARADLVEITRTELDPKLAALCRGAHDEVRAYVAQPVGEIADALDGSLATVAPSPVIDLLCHVQAAQVRDALAGTEYAGLPVLAVAAPFGLVDGVPAGAVSVRELAGLYPFESVVQAKLLTGAQLHDYLEHAAAYFRTSDGRTPPTELRRAPNDVSPHGIPDFLYDIVGSDRGAVSYTIDVRQPVGQRISGLLIDGKTVEPSDQLVLAVNDYRGSGGGAYPHIVDAETVFSGTTGVRDLVIDFVREHSPLSASALGHAQWQLIL